MNSKPKPNLNVTTISLPVVFDIRPRPIPLVKDALKIARAVSGLEAFRHYNWLLNHPAVNKAGNFRGMVISHRWSTTFHFIDDGLSLSERLNLLAALVSNITQAAPQIDRILESNESWTIKGAQLSTQVNLICTRTVLGGIPAGAHLLAVAAQAALGLVSATGMCSTSHWRGDIRSIDRSLNARFNTFTSGENIHLHVNKYFGKQYVF